MVFGGRRIEDLETEVTRLRATVSELTTTLAECRVARQGLETRLAPIADVEAEGHRLWSLTKTTLVAAGQEAAKVKAETDALRTQYAVGFQRFSELQVKLRQVEEDLENVDLGLYKPHLTYESSDKYKEAIFLIRARQKEFIKAGEATRRGEAWTVRGDAAEGERLSKKFEKLILRAFNSESEAAIANVSWSNVDVMRNRIAKAFDNLNDLGEMMRIELTAVYRDLRLEELNLVFLEAEAKQKEREAERGRRAKEREEERVQRELRKEKEDAEDDEARYSKALTKAREELERAAEAEKEAMQARILTLQAELTEAHSRKERAIAQAQLTRMGHVYIISNIGAFGETVVKVGLTRRLDPRERIKELGDASVPFPFDLHALIKSDDAPALETKLHNRLWDKRINWSNDRKEFFRASLADVRAALIECGHECSMTDLAEAREYRETLSAIQRASTASEAAPKPVVHQLPEDPFG